MTGMEGRGGRGADTVVAMLLKSDGRRKKGSQIRRQYHSPPEVALCNRQDHPDSEFKTLFLRAGEQSCFFSVCWSYSM